jgi:uncharacterized protein YecE (DUF72 family)
MKVKRVSLMKDFGSNNTLRVQSLTDYLIGTGGWAYFNVPDKPPLKVYSDIFNFVEVNYTFYEYPDLRLVEQWRRSVPSDFTFSVRCHQDLTHRIGLKPVDEAYRVLIRMLSYCDILGAPFLVLETPASYIINHAEAKQARTLFSSFNFRGVNLAWEIRAPVTKDALDLMQDFNMIECVDLSVKPPSVASDVVYSRLFGKGKHNIYQFSDDELLTIDHEIESIKPRTAALSYHGVKMNMDAARYMHYKHTGTFVPITDFTGIDSARAVLFEDTPFPISKSALIENQGWKVIDLSLDKRVHLAELLANIPDKTYNSVDEVAKALEAIM